MNLAKGDVVLVPFPFTDLSQTKLRLRDASTLAIAVSSALWTTPK